MRKLWYVIFLFSLLISCTDEKKEKYGSDLERVLSTDTLRVATLCRSTSYFDYQGIEMGYEYEMAQRLAESLQVHLKIITAQDVDQMIELLEKGTVDLIAYPINISIPRKERVQYVNHEYKSKQVLVQRKTPKQLLQVSSVIDLIGKEVVVVENSKYHKRLLTLDEEVGGGISIQTVSNEENEESLIEKVSSGEIDYTVADDRIAKVNKTYYDNIDISVLTSLEQRSAWAVRNGSTELLDTINHWFESIKANYAYQYLQHKYFELEKNVPKKNPKYISHKKICEFDPIFKRYAPEIKWDWKLLASIAYQESRFNPLAKSWAGAQGLMQMMPATAEKFGVDSVDLFTPEPCVKAAVKYIGRVEKNFGHIENSEERVKFILASYNAGVGHIRDAMALAEKHGKSSDQWSDVSIFLEMKAKPEFFNDPVVKHGYLRGDEVSRFVNEIMLRYHEYNEVIVD